MRTARLTAILERTLEAKAAQATDPGTAATVARFDPDRFDPDRFGPHRATTTGGRRGARRRIDDNGGLPVPAPDGSQDLDGSEHRDGFNDRGGSDDLDLAALPTTRGSRSGRGRRRVLVAAAACLVVTMTLAGVLVVRNGDGTEEADVAVRPVQLGDPPDGWLVPAWLPEGMELWGIDTSTSEPPDGSDPATIPQLFGDPVGGRALYITSHRYSIDPGTVEDVAVRGTTGAAGTGWGAAEEELGDAVTWDERGVPISALYRGVNREEAIAVLDTLEWRTDDPLDGFAPPADEAWPLRAEATSRSTVTRGADLLYSEGVPAASGGTGSHNVLRVFTSTSSAISAGYLETWYLKGTGDGTGPLVSYRDDRHELSVHWADGRSVQVAPEGAETSLTRDDLERIATSTTAASTDELAALRDGAESRIESLPVVATAGTTIGAIDIHAESGLVRLCLRQPARPGAECETSTMGGSEWGDGSATATSQWTIDGSWNVAIASLGEVPRIFDDSDPTTPAPEAGELAAETTVVGDWTVQLVQPPGADSFCFGSEVAMSCLGERRG